MTAVRVLSFTAGLAALAIALAYLRDADPPPIVLRALVVLYIGAAVGATRLAAALNRSAIGWLILNLLLPFVALVALALRPALPPSSLSDADAAWSRMDVPGNPMVVTALLLFDRPVDFDAFKATIEHRLLRFERFRQRIMRRNGSPYWEEAADVDLDFHVRRTRLAPRGDESELRELVGAVMSTPLDRSRPLWQWILVENVGSGSALIFRAHHCIADGVALVRVFLSLTDESPAPARPTPGSDARPAAKTAVARTWSRHPSTFARRAAGLAWNGIRLLCMGPDRSTALRGEPRGHKCVLWSAPIRLQSLRDVGHRFACHVNDVVLAGLAGALGRYLRAHGDLSKDLEIRMIIPVDLRPCQEEITLGNRFAVVFLRLPLDLENPAQRLIEIQRRTSRIKASQQAGAAFAILKLAGRAPGALEKLLVRLFARKATAVFTNLAGPRHDVFLANRRVCRIVPWVPQIGGIGLGISVFSYAGDVTLGITTDAGVIPDPEAILAGFQDEIAILIGSSRTAHAQS